MEVGVMNFFGIGIFFPSLQLNKALDSANFICSMPIFVGRLLHDAPFKSWQLVGCNELVNVESHGMNGHRIVEDDVLLANACITVVVFNSMKHGQ